MLPFLVFIGLFVVLLTLGALQMPVAFGWWTALRFALAGLFLLTASAHWGKRRPDLIKMVPPSLPYKEFLVSATGILEILGALGLMLGPMARPAGLGLSVLLIALFPANIHAARERLPIGGRPATPLPARTFVQLIFLVATLAVVFGRDPALR